MVSPETETRRGRAPKVQGDDAFSDLDREVHASRDQENPSDEPVHEDVGDWSPPSLLEAPPPRPGYVQRWIRVRRGNQDDLQNFMSRRREGWQPRDPGSVPGGFDAPTQNHGNFGRCIMVEGMVLCEMSKRRNEQRRAFYQGQLAKQTDSVERQLLKIQQPGHPIRHEAATKVTVGRRPNVQDDEAA